MKLKLRDMTMIHAGLASLSGMNFKSKLSYRIARNLKKLEDEVKTFESNRLKLVEEYAEKDSDGKPIIENERYKISPDKQREFQDEFDKLLNEEIEVDLMRLKLDDLENYDISPDVFARIMPIIEE